MSLQQLQEDQSQTTIRLNDAILQRWPIGSGVVYRKPNKQRQIATVRGVKEGKLIIHIQGQRTTRKIALKSIIQPRPISQ